MKPQEKVVNAQDIESSLYYVHFNSEADDQLLVPEDSEIGDVLNEDWRGGHPSVPTTANVRRKPLLPKRQPAPSDRPEPPPKIYPFFQPPFSGPGGSTQLGRKPIGRGSREGHRFMESASAFESRKVFGPRPMHVQSPALENVPHRQNVDVRRWSELPSMTPPRLSARPYDRKQNDLDEIYSANFANFPGGRPSLDYSGSSGSRNLEQEQGRGSLSLTDTGGLSTSEDDFPDLSLTLIRRYDGAQCNVGKILKEHDSSDGLSLELLSPAYSKIDVQAPPPTGKEEAGNRLSPRQASCSQNGFKVTDKHATSSAPFRCHLRATSHSNKSIPNYRSDSFDSSFGGRPATRSSLDMRRSVQQSSFGFGTNGLGHDGLPEHKKASAKGYHFQTPWNSVCAFSTGVAGRSLKCRHDRVTSSTTSIASPSSSSVSELRFNLPSSKPLGSPAPKSPQPGTPRETKRSSFFSGHHRQPSHPHEADNNGRWGAKVDLQDRLDLSLGQEHAGGGFGGKQVKLGKLIIENEGLQMLDLIVAANMALWWKVYDRTT